MKNNYKEHDTLNLYVKKNKLSEITDCYKSFGWELKEETENKRYEDIVDLTFTREHKLNNKDELQLQQVYMEEKLNEIAKLERHKHSKITSFGLCFGVIGLAIVVASVFLILTLTTINLIFGIISAVVGLTLLQTGAIMLPKLYQKEKINYEQKHRDLNQELQAILTKAKSLVGGADEK